MIVDAHHHFWNPTRLPQAWMTDEHVAINRAFEPADLEPLASDCGVTTTVLVQSAADDRDTDYMFELVDDVPWVGAVTAWCKLDDFGETRRRLPELRAHTKFRGLRHLIHQEADAHWILRDAVQPSLALLEQEGVLLELPAVFPDHLADVPELARRYPGLTLVIDHLAKPPFGTDAMPSWNAQLVAAAEQPNVFAKVSGLNTMVASGWSSSDLIPAVAPAYKAFGAARLLFGSDWPVALLNGTYGEVVRRTVAAIRSVAGDDAQAILADNALRLYGAPPTRDTVGRSGS